MAALSLDFLHGPGPMPPAPHQASEHELLHSGATVDPSTDLFHDSDFMLARVQDVS